MERLFANILRWLGLPFDESCYVENGYAEKKVDKDRFWELFSAVQGNDSLYYSLASFDSDKLVIRRREFLDGYWTRCELTIKRDFDECSISYKLLGYEALVGGNLILVDSITSLKELGD